MIKKKPSTDSSLPTTLSDAIESIKARSSASLADLAYERIEELLVNCELKPGLHLTMQDLQSLVGFGRTPVHQAINRLASDTLIVVAPRHGLQIAPIDLSRDRVLLRLRADVERFVIELATERSGASQRNQMIHLKKTLERFGPNITIEQFNMVDRRIDQILLEAANEPFVEGTLRPLHTIFRRLGWVYHMQSTHAEKLTRTVEGHIAVIDAVASGNVRAAVKASDDLMGFVVTMFDVLEREVPPSCFDVAYADPDIELEPESMI